MLIESSQRHAAVVKATLLIKSEKNTGSSRSLYSVSHVSVSRIPFVTHLQLSLFQVTFPPTMLSMLVLYFGVEEFLGHTFRFYFLRYLDLLS